MDGSVDAELLRSVKGLFYLGRELKCHFNLCGTIHVRALVLCFIQVIKFK